MRPLAYRIESRMVYGFWRAFIIAKCSVCEKTSEIQWNGKPNPNFIARHLNRLGWDFDAYRQSGNKCSDCNVDHTTIVPVKEPDLKQFCNRLRWSREQIHLSRDDLAAESGINRRILDHLEDGTNYEELQVLAGRKFAAVLIKHGSPINANWLIGIDESTNVLSLNLRRVCARKSITDGMLASKSGVPISLIRAILDGALSTTNRVADLAKALDVDVEVLVGGDWAAIPILKLVSPPPSVSASPPVSANSNASASTVLSADNLKAIRIAKGLSQSELAVLICQHVPAEISWNPHSVQTKISRVERGKRLLALDQLLAAATIALECEPVTNTATVEDRVEDAAVPVIQLPVQRPEPALRLIDVEGLQIDLYRAENDLNGLREILADMDSVKIMVKETTEKVDAIRKILSVIQEPKQEIQESIEVIEPKQPTKRITSGKTSEHLSFIGGTWFFRRRIPERAREIFGGGTEIRQNLGTADRDEAKKRKMRYERAFNTKMTKIEG